MMFKGLLMLIIMSELFTLQMYEFFFIYSKFFLIFFALFFNKKYTMLISSYLYYCLEESHQCYFSFFQPFGVPKC